MKPKPRIKTAEEVAKETEFYRRQNLPGCIPKYVGATDMVLTAYGVEIGSKSRIFKRDKEIFVLYVLPSLDRYEAIARLPVAKP
jgi:hypothetical protein